ncbi:MAG TPA: rhodanese-like domain-containing protein [Gemmatimonadota bacterium]|nr:rhodanese-like domain-containing protein [Gemmatimonadota bacterium]
MRRRAAEPRLALGAAGLVAAGLVAAGLGATLLTAACRGRPADGPQPERAEARPWVADTQYVIDSTGGRLQIIIGRSAGEVRELIPRAGAGDPHAPGAFRILEPRIAHSLMQAARPKWYVIDLRTAPVYVTEGHIRGAKLVPLDALEDNLVDLHVRDDQVVLLYAEGTARARDAARILAAYGYPHVRVLGGGFPAWKKAGLPVEERS